jgi:putative transcription factor
MEGECEVCGRAARRLVETSIEGSVMRTCYECSKLGTRVRVKKPSRKPPLRFHRAAKERVLEPRPGYGELLRARREELGLTQEELGKRLNEKTSVIARLEAERMMPSEALARKIERHLGIRILEEVEEPEIRSSGAKTGELTLGDVVKIKRRQP